jgi:hypothetical protein
VDGAVIGAPGVAVPITVEPGALSPEHFAVWGPGATQPVTVADSVQFRVQTRDAFGNNRVDDGALGAAGNLTLGRAVQVEPVKLTVIVP